MRPRLALALVLLLAACKTSASDSPTTAAPLAEPGFGPWTSTLHAEHPLVGSAWHVAEARAIGRAELEVELSAARYVLLGETHDNPDHHRLQGELVRALASGERRPAVAFEMLDPGKQVAIDAFSGELDEFATTVAWAESGWPAWPIYRPVFEATLAADLPILAAELPREQSRMFMAEGLAMFDPAFVARFALAQPLAPELHAAWLDEMFASHCELVPREHLGGMVEIQRIRDARMADALLQGAAKQGRAILIAGGGHARRVGVPRLLHMVEPSAAIVGVGFVAVTPERTKPSDYDQGEFDVLVFTPDVEREDPCESMRASMAG